MSAAETGSSSSCSSPPAPGHPDAGSNRPCQIRGRRRVGQEGGEVPCLRSVEGRQWRRSRPGMPCPACTPRPINWGVGIGGALLVLQTTSAVLVVHKGHDASSSEQCQREVRSRRSRATLPTSDASFHVLCTPPRRLPSPFGGWQTGSRKRASPDGCATASASDGAARKRHRHVGDTLSTGIYRQQHLWFRRRACRRPD